MATIEPYKLRPAPPAIAILTPDGEALEENGELHPLEHLPRGVKVYGSWDTVDELLRAGTGEAFYWDSEPVRWRHRRFHDYGGWERRHTDVTVLRVPFPDDLGVGVAGLVEWRDWLARYHAAPQGSLGSSGMSLLRGTLEEPLWTAMGQLPPIRWTLGGRQELGVEPRTAAYGCTHLDLPAAYARTLGELRYGGVWREVAQPQDPGRWAAEGLPVFAHATVRIPDVRFGPLPRRPKARPEWAWDRYLLEASYPTSKTVTGCWCWEELAEAIAAGARVKIDRLWVHVVDHGAAGQPFLPWWAAVQEGRAMPGFGGQLAKASANALWGQFAISDAPRQIVRYVDDKPVVTRLPIPGGGAPRSWDLAETITGRVRARVAALMREADDLLLSVHTDGGWVRSTFRGAAGFLEKDHAAALELVGPQVLRYRRPERPTWLYRVSGVPSRVAPRMFKSIWAAGGV